MFAKLFGRRKSSSVQPKLTLLVMRLADMHRVHPDMVTRVCHKCGHKVGIYPSGQKAMARVGERWVNIVCHVCQPTSEGFPLAPGALTEPFESVAASPPSSETTS